MSGAALDILPYLHPLTYSQQLCHYRQGWRILKVTLLVPDRPSLCSFQVREWRKWETLKEANPAGSDRLARGDSPRAAGTHCRGYVTLACARWMRLLPGSHYLKKKKSLHCSLQRIKGHIYFSENLNWRSAKGKISVLQRTQ